MGGLGLGAGRNRLDSVTPDGGRPASDPEFTIRQLIVENHIDLAVLTGDMYGWNVHPNPEYANAVMAAFNDWTDRALAHAAPAVPGLHHRQLQRPGGGRGRDRPPRASATTW